MCLGVPGRIDEIIDEQPLTRTGLVDFDGVTQEVNLAFVPEANVGQYVIVHAGFGLSIIDEAEAKKVFQTLSELDQIES